MIYFAKSQVICPGDSDDMAYWSRRWRVNTSQIKDAIINTGSVDATVVKQEVRKSRRAGKFLLNMIYQYFKHVNGTQKAIVGYTRLKRV